MDSFFIKKIKPLNLFLYSLAFYPLLKFNLSSVILFITCFLIVINSYKHRTFTVTKKDIKAFFLLSLYLIITVISISYSENKEDAIKRTTRLIPLLVLPAILIFCKPEINLKTRNRLLNLYLAVNLIYMLILFSIYIKTVGSSQLSFVEMVTKRSVFHPLINEHLGEDIITPHKAYFSMWFVILSIFSLHKTISFYNKNKITSLIYAITFSFFSFFILAFFSFPNVLALTLSIIVFIAYNVKKLKIGKREFFFISSIVVCLLGSVIYFKTDSIDVKRGLNFIDSILTKEDLELNDPRIEIYKSLNSLYKKADLIDVLFGFGIGDVQDALNNEYKNRLVNATGKNKLLFSEEFNDDYWFKNNIDIIPNVENTPSGIKKADIVKQKQTKVESSYNISNNFNVGSEKEFTFSVYAKKGTSKHLILRLGNIEQRANFNLELGTKESYNNLVNAKISKVGEWYRCSITTLIKGEALVAIGISNSKRDYKYLENNKTLYLWGAQLEQGRLLTPYVKNDSNLLKYVSEEGLNTHNNYIYFLLVGGVFCLLYFLLAIGVLFFISIRNKDTFQLTFCIILATNFLTENILSRHLGLIFISFMLLVFFTKNPNKIETKV